MSIISESSGKVAKVSVLKKIPLKDDKRINTPSHSKSLSQPSNNVLTPSLPSTARKIADACENEDGRHEIQNIASPEKSSDLEIPSDMKTFAVQVEKFKNWAEEIVSSQQKDIARITGAVFRVENDLQALKDLMREINGNLKNSHQNIEYEKNLVEIRNEVKRMSEKIHQKEEISDWNEAASLLARNLNAIAGDVKYLNSQVEEVDTLSSNLEALVSRVHNIESQEQTSVSKKCSVRAGEALDDLPSRKRSRNPGEKQNHGEKEVNLSQHYIKKRRLDEPQSAEKNDKGHHTTGPSVIDRSSPELVSQILNPNQARVSAQSHTISRESSHRKPQVLIYGSISKAPAQVLKEAPVSSSTSAKENTAPVSLLSAKKTVHNKIQNQSENDTILTNVTTKSDQNNMNYIRQNIDFMNQKSNHKLNPQLLREATRSMKEPINTHIAEKSRKSNTSEYLKSDRQNLPITTSKNPLMTESRPDNDYGPRLSLDCYKSRESLTTSNVYENVCLF